MPGGVFPLDHRARVIFSGPPGNRTPIALMVQTKRLPVGPAARIIKRSVRELNPVFLLTEEVCCREHLQTIFQSDPGWIRTIIVFLVVTQASLPLDHGIISDRGGSRTHRHEALDLAAMPICVPGQVAGPGVAPGGPGL